MPRLLHAFLAQARYLADLPSRSCEEATGALGSAAESCLVELMGSGRKRGSGTVVRMGPHRYALTAAHNRPPDLIGGRSTGGLPCRSFTEYDLMAVHLGSAENSGCALPKKVTAGVVVARRAGGRTYATDLRVDGTSCCKDPGIGSYNPKGVSSYAQTRGWCLVGGDSGAGVFSLDQCVGVAIGSHLGAAFVLSVYEDLPVAETTLGACLANGPTRDWPRIDQPKAEARLPGLTQAARTFLRLSGLQQVRFP
jgi:hypothetical protein